MPFVSLFCFFRVYLADPDPLFIFSYGDPDYGYLFNALLISTGQSPWHIDHPGTPVQLLGALLMLTRYTLFGTEASLAADFFKHSLQYHRDLLLLAFSAFFSAQWFCGYQLLRTGAALGVVLLIQALPFFFFDSVEYFAHTSPEIWITAVCLALIPVCWFQVEKSEENSAALNNRAIAAGMLMGLLVTLKLYSAPVLLCIFLFPKPRQWLFAAAAAAFTFLNVTAVIWLDYSRLLWWLKRVTLHSGSYGTGPAGLPGPSQWLRNASTLYREEYLYLLGIVAVLLPFYLVWARRKGRPRFGPELLSALALFALLLKHDPVHRYLLPFIPAAGIFLARGSLLPFLPRQLIALAGAAALVVTFPGNLKRVASGRYEIGKGAALLRKEFDKTPCAVMLLDAAPIEPFALFSGHLATPMQNWQAELNAIYPNFFFPNVGVVPRNFGNYPTTIAELDRELVKYPCRTYLYTVADVLVPAMRMGPKLPDSNVPPTRLGDTGIMLLKLGSVAAGNGPGHGVVRQR